MRILEKISAPDAFAARLLNPLQSLFALGAPLRQLAVSEIRVPQGEFLGQHHLSIRE